MVGASTELLMKLGQKLGAGGSVYSMVGTTAEEGMAGVEEGKVGEVLVMVVVGSAVVALNPGVVVMDLGAVGLEMVVVDWVVVDLGAWDLVEAVLVVVSLVVVGLVVVGLGTEVKGSVVAGSVEAGLVEVA